jgi:hypothetical protein
MFIITTSRPALETWAVEARGLRKKVWSRWTNSAFESRSSR